MYRREGSNPSFSAKKPENAEFSGFFDALNLLLSPTFKKESGEKLDKMACYYARYYAPLIFAITPHPFFISLFRGSIKQPFVISVHVFVLYHPVSRFPWF